MSRYVSLVPSVSHTLVELGVRDQLVGCTTFCVSPPDLHRNCVLIGGTKNPDLELIKQLKPDIVFVNSEENVSKDIVELQTFVRVVNTHPRTVVDVVEMINSLAAAVHREKKGQQLSGDLQNLIHSFDAPLEVRSFIYLIWQAPYMSVNSNTYISDLLGYMGLRNCLGEGSVSRYPEIDVELIVGFNPDYIFLSSEPFAFRNRHRDKLLAELGGHIAPHIQKIDGQLCSWHGAMTIDALREAARFRVKKPCSLFF